MMKVLFAILAIAQIANAKPTTMKCKLNTSGNDGGLTELTVTEDKDEKVSVHVKMVSWEGTTLIDDEIASDLGNCMKDRENSTLKWCYKFGPVESSHMQIAEKTQRKMNHWTHQFESQDLYVFEIASPFIDKNNEKLSYLGVQAFAGSEKIGSVWLNLEFPKSLCTTSDTVTEKPVATL